MGRWRGTGAAARTSHRSGLSPTPQALPAAERGAIRGGDAGWRRRASQGRAGRLPVTCRRESRETPGARRGPPPCVSVPPSPPRPRVMRRAAGRWPRSALRPSIVRRCRRAPSLFPSLPLPSPPLPPPAAAAAARPRRRPAPARPGRRRRRRSPLGAGRAAPRGELRGGEGRGGGEIRRVLGETHARVVGAGRLLQ